MNPAYARYRVSTLITAITDVLEDVRNKNDARAAVLRGFAVHLSAAAAKLRVVEDGAHGISIEFPVGDATEREVPPAVDAFDRLADHLRSQFAMLSSDRQHPIPEVMLDLMHAHRGKDTVLQFTVRFRAQVRS